MRTRAGEESVEHRGNGEARIDGLHSVSGGRGGDGRSASSQDSGDESGSADRGDARDVTKAPWFNPIDSAEVSDCPGGVCPVPWAIAKEPEAVKEDLVNHPAHYAETGGVECIEAIEAQMTKEEFEGYLRGNCAKYLWRWKHKGGVQDLNKCRWYLDRLIAINEG